MEHITMQYGQECNLIKSTLEEFRIMEKFLEAHGVLVRICKMSKDEVEWQAQNPYQVWANLYSSHFPLIKKQGDNEMEDKHWCR